MRFCGIESNFNVSPQATVLYNEFEKLLPGQTKVSPEGYPALKFNGDLHVYVLYFLNNEHVFILLYGIFYTKTDIFFLNFYKTSKNWTHSLHESCNT